MQWQAKLLRHACTWTTAGVLLCSAVAAQIVDSTARQDSGDQFADVEASDPSLSNCLDTLGACEAGAENRWPLWYVQAESIFLWRDNDAAAARFSWLSSVNTRSIDFDAGIGPQITLGIRTSPQSGWEGEYFGVFGANGVGNGVRTITYFIDTSGAVFGRPNNSDLFVANDPFPIIVTSLATQIEYQSELQNAEIDYCHTWERFSLLAGFRYVGLNENFEERLSYTRAGVWHQIYERRTENNLYGGQLGARWKNAYQRLTWEVTGKAGVFGNDAQSSQVSREGISGVDRFPTRYGSTVAFVGDINVSLGFRLSPIWGLRGGYNVMWIDQVALAPDQPPTLTSSEVAIDGSVFLHGANVGLEANW